MSEAMLTLGELEAAMSKLGVKQAQKLSDHWFGKTSSTAKKKLKK
ncbi:MULTISPECIES: hypothetical protein [Aeromonas]|nr:hypothetical protein [Aeromonas veronii]